MEQAKPKVIVIGGTGLIGSKVVAGLNEQGYEAVAAAPNTGVNTLTGEGLADVLEGASVVVDVSNSPSFADDAVMDFFTRSTVNLLKYEDAAGVKHHIALSVVGTDRLAESGSGYMHAKVAQEKLIKESAIPYTVVHATQFFEFSKSIADAATDGDTVRLAPVPYQPIAADDVAKAVEGVAAGPPLNTTIEIAGPEVFRFDEFIKKALDARGDPRQVLPDPKAKYFGALLTETSLVPGKDARLGATRFDDWLAAQPAQPQTAKTAA
jgi:uncharacterized protein YbjT (DUF2867 family)